MRLRPPHLSARVLFLDLSIMLSNRLAPIQFPIKPPTTVYVPKSKLEKPN